MSATTATEKAKYRMEVLERVRNPKILTQKQLAAAGWKHLFNFADGWLVFAQGTKRIIWDEKTSIIEIEYTAS